uniref:GPN-loop GTPase n=1 Tax=Pyxicephalus adspersus TaxID=30357 RepID=A0AAV3ATS1_PYXAD|nr:TPA: hypothetical protein GDO54_009803 [Pyxicephalus adspersus]
MAEGGGEDGGSPVCMIVLGMAGSGKTTFTQFDFLSSFLRYGLGPNGGIVTALNLFATRFDQVVKFIEKRQKNSRFVLIDTPGQIEVFTWSASGAIITEALEEEKRREQQQQLERLHTDMGSVALHPGPHTEEDVAGPSDLILTRGNVQEEEEEPEDSDTDDIDHSVAEARLEEPAFQNFLQQAKSKYREKMDK